MQEHLKVPRCLLVNQYGRPARPKFLRNKSVINPETKDFHCIPLLRLFDIVCSLGDGKWSRTRPVEVVRSATALSRDSSRLCSFGPMFFLSLCHYVTINISMDDTDTEHTFHVDFPVLIPSHGAVCSSSRRPFRKKTVLHLTLLHGKASLWENKHIFRVPAIGFHSHASWAIET